MVTPLPLPVMVLPNVPVWDPFDQPVNVPSSKPASGILVVVASTFDANGANDIATVGSTIHQP
jgi:hypothetical protein